MAQKYPQAFGAGLRRNRAVSGAFFLGLLLAGCAGAPADDPLEPANRAVHGFNKGLDRVVIKPFTTVTSVIPDPVFQGVSNLGDTLSLPGEIGNSVLQGNVEETVVNTLRLGINLTMGVGGLFDAATGIGLPEPSTDFGETLHVWGVGEGAYLELPVLGPSTVRDAAGRVIDTVLDPLGNIFAGDDARAVTGIRIASRLGDRVRYSDTFESILYDSADSYAQARLLYLQNRRFELGQAQGADPDAGFIDPYEE